MVTNPNFFGQSTTGTPSQIEDGVDFPHTGLIKTLALGMKQNYVINGFDITPSSETAGTVSTGTIMRDGQVISVSGGSPPYPISLDATYTNGYHLLVVDSTNTVVVRNPASPTIGADKVPAYVDGDVIIAVLTHTGVNPFNIQYLTVNKTKNSLSIGEGSGTYSEEMSITSDGTNVTFTGSTNTNMNFTPSGSGQVRVTTGDLEVQNGNFEVPNGYSEITVVESITDGGGAGLSAGAPVYPTNYSSGKITVQLADATIAASKYPAIGLVYANISAGGNGKVVIQGLTGDISATLFDAGSYSEGDIIYLSPNIGKLTNTRPTADTDTIQNIGRIVHLSTFTAGSSGTAKILVGGSGRSNDVTNDGFVTTNASSLPTARQITAGIDIGLTDAGAGSTLTIANTSTLDSVTTRDAVTTNAISVGTTTITGAFLPSRIGTLDSDATVIVNYADASQNSNPNRFTLPLATTHDGKILFIKNLNPTTIMEVFTLDVFENNGVSTDSRYINPTTLHLKPYQSVMLQALSDSTIIPLSPTPTSLASGWYILDSDETGGGGAEVNDLSASVTWVNVPDANITESSVVQHREAIQDRVIVETGNDSPAASAAEAGNYFYRASGETATFTVPNDSYVGEYYVLMNNSGSAITISKDAGDTLIGSTSVSDGSAVTIISVAANTWFVIG